MTLDSLRYGNKQQCCCQGLLKDKDLKLKDKALWSKDKDLKSEDKDKDKDL